MHIGSELIAYFIRFLMWLFRQVGINGILVVVILIELGGMRVYYSAGQDDYQYEDNCRLTEVVSIEPVSAEDKRLVENGIKIEADRKYYAVTVKLENYYSTDLEYMHIAAKNQNDYEVDCTRIQYYGTLEYYYVTDRLLVPAGASNELDYIISMQDEIAEQTETLTLYEWDSEKEDGEQDNKVTVELP